MVTDADVLPQQILVDNDTIKLNGSGQVYVNEPGIGAVPVGTVLDWLKSLTGVPAIPANFVECNGQTLSDADSPMDGEVIPNLNGNNNFLRGAATSGGTGGAATINIQHSHNVSSNGQQASNVGGGGGYDLGCSTTLTSTNGLSTAQAIEPPYYDVVKIVRIK